ncbi:MAG TPA: serine hydrolase domain-containing protein [Dehalococcoidia bacterium]|nr:serine hydrolase domain-containing protein [Dehalococcoidia bacterium]
MVAENLVATKPEDVGVDSEKLEALFARAKRDVDEGGLPSAQVAVARHGRLAGMRTFGRAVQGGAMRPATDQTLYTIFSCTKAIVAAAVWTLFEDGLLRLDERVVDIIPEFNTNGKDVITVEQVLLHTAGFPMAPLGPGQWETREGRLAAFSRWRLNWEPGSRFQYHATSAHWVLVEIIERRTGVEYHRFLRERILDPMGLDELYVGLPRDQNERVADVLHVVEPTPPPGGWGEVTPNIILRFNSPEQREVGVPGGGGIATAGQLALFYQPLINRGETAAGKRIMKPETIAFATAVRTLGRYTDPMTNLPVSRGLSIIVANNDGHAHERGFGHNASPKAFGHAGAGGQVAWGDPETGISVGYCTNGFVNPEDLGRRTLAISSLAGACVKG